MPDSGRDLADALEALTGGSRYSLGASSGDQQKAAKPRGSKAAQESAAMNLGQPGDKFSVADGATITTTDGLFSISFTKCLTTAVDGQTVIVPVIEQS